MNGPSLPETPATGRRSPLVGDLKGRPVVQPQPEGDRLAVQPVWGRAMPGATFRLDAVEEAHGFQGADGSPHTGFGELEAGPISELAAVYRERGLDAAGGAPVASEEHGQGERRIAVAEASQVGRQAIPNVMGEPVRSRSR
jgi:hypothetical protein